MVITQTVYLHEANGQRVVFSADMSNCGYTLIAISEAAFDIEEESFTAIRMADIERRIDQAQDQYATTMRQLREERERIIGSEESA